MQKTRDIWLDIMKGIGIIMVVLGHSGNDSLAPYIYWFHMPLFFITSGYTFKPTQNMRDFTRKWTFRTFSPYFSFGLLIIVIHFLFQQWNLLETLKETVKLLYGGIVLDGPLGVFWFITSLYLSQLIFNIILIKTKGTKLAIAAVLSLYLLSHLYSIATTGTRMPIPWNLDVSILGVFYLAVGFYAKRYMPQLTQNKNSGLMVGFAATAFFLLDFLNIIDYSLDMKYKNYTHLILDAIIPLIFVLAIFCFSKKLVSTPWSSIFSYIGRNTIMVMYLHLPINTLLDTDNWLLKSVCGLIIPLLLNHILSRYQIYRFFFLGKSARRQVTSKAAIS